jgi:hypothetical protein
MSLVSLILIAVPSMTWAQAEAPWLILDGVDPGYVEVPHDPALNPEHITVEAWVYLITGRSYRGDGCPAIVGKSYGDSWWVSVCSNKIRFISHGLGSIQDSSSQVPTGEWVHVAVTYDGSQVRFYFNGSLDSEFNHNRGPMPVNDKPLRIGSDVSYDSRPHAAIDEVRIWSTARSEGEIAAMMNTSINSAMTDLVAVWNLDGDATAAVGGFDGSNVGNTVYGNTLPEPNPCVREFFLTSAAHSDGNLGTKWFTDVSLLNQGGLPASVYVYLLAPNVDNSNPVRTQFLIDSGESLALDDLIFDLFGEDNMSAALKICSNEWLLIDSRTFNASAKAVATFGQGVPGVELGTASNDIRTLIGLYENDQFRTNIGMLNTGPEATTVTVGMYTQDNTWLGNKEFELPPYGYKQRSAIFTRITNDDIENGTIRVWSSGSRILVYASVVDNLSGDGTYKLAR